MTILDTDELSHVVARGLRPHRVFSSQGDTAHSDDQQDTHLKVTQGADVVTGPPKPESTKTCCFLTSLRLH